MTANQLSYWRLQEDKRSNLAKEAETNRSNLVKEAETERSNKVSEAIKQVQNDLEARNLMIKDRQALAQLAELYLDKGTVDWGSLPDDLEHRLEQEFNFQVTDEHGNMKDYDFGDFLSDLGSEFKKVFGSRGFGSIMKALF